MTQLEAATDASAQGAKADQRRLFLLIEAAVLMGAIGVMLVGNGVWALTFEGVKSADLKRALNGHSLTSAGVLVLVVGLVLLVCVAGVLIGPKANRWVGLVARLAGIAVAAVAAFSGIWLVTYYPGWAITYTGRTRRLHIDFVRARAARCVAMGSAARSRCRRLRTEHQGSQCTKRRRRRRACVAHARRHLRPAPGAVLPQRGFWPAVRGAE